MFEVKQLCGQLCLGKQGENLARIVYFEEPSLWKEKFGEGKCELLHQRNGDAAPYPVLLDTEDGKVCWKITNADTAVVGEGKCELYYSVNGVIVKSKIWTTNVFPSLGDNVAEAPEPYKAWVDAVFDAAAKVEDATTHNPVVGENKNWFVWDSETEQYVDSGVCAEGSDGYTPKKGEDYWTPEDKGEIKTYIDEQTEIIKSDVEGLQQRINEEAHFRGYLPTNAKIQSLEATPNDFAYSAESGTKWVYDVDNGWVDTGTPVPDQLTPASDTTPLINGTPSVGEENAYARGDHRHPTDTTRASVEQLNKVKSDLKKVIDTCGDFELIDSAEFTEDVVTIIPNLNGNHYKELYMVFTIPTVNADGSNTDKARIRCFANSKNTEFFTQGSTAVENYNASWKMWLHFKFIGNYITGDLWHRKNANQAYLSAPSSSTHSGYTQPGFEMAEDYFDKLTIKMQDANYQQLLRCFPTGTKYDLWGVKK